MGARLRIAGLASAAVLVAAAPAHAQTINGCDIKPQTSCPNANLANQNLAGVHLEDAYLPGAHLDASRLDGANLPGSNLFEATLKGASIDGTNFTQAILTRATLDGAHQHGNPTILAAANLRGASLVGTDLTNANLRRADFFHATMTNTILTGASFCQTTMPDGSTRSDSKGCNPPGKGGGIRSTGTGVVERASTGTKGDGGSNDIADVSGGGDDSSRVQRTGTR